MYIITKENIMKKMLLVAMIIFVNLLGFIGCDAAEITNKERGYVLRKMEVEVKDTGLYKNVNKYKHEDGTISYNVVVDTIPYLQFASDSLKREIEEREQAIEDSLDDIVCKKLIKLNSIDPNDTSESNWKRIKELFLE
jgi:hypothetical protein